jgi:hypothetical protein
LKKFLSSLKKWLIFNHINNSIANLDKVLKVLNFVFSLVFLDLKFGNKTYTVCETFSEKEMYERFVKSAQIDDTDGDVFVKSSNPSETPAKTNLFSKVMSKSLVNWSKFNQRLRNQ